MSFRLHDRAFRASLGLAIAALAAGCAGGTISAPDGPLTFEVSCKGWQVSWSESDNPFVGVLSRTEDAEPATADPVADYLKCSSLGARRGLSETDGAADWATARFTSDPTQQVLDAPPGDYLEVEVGTYATAESSGGFALPPAEGTPEVVVTLTETADWPEATTPDSGPDAP